MFFHEAMWKKGEFWSPPVGVLFPFRRTAPRCRDGASLWSVGGQRSHCLNGSWKALKKRCKYHALFQCTILKTHGLLMFVSKPHDFFSQKVLSSPRLKASVSCPPCSCPTYPGGAPMRRDTACCSMYSDMSKRKMPQFNVSKMMSLKKNGRKNTLSMGNLPFFYHVLPMIFAPGFWPKMSPLVRAAVFVVKELRSQSLGQLRLPHARGPGEEEGTSAQVVEKTAAVNSLQDGSIWYNSR